MDIISFAGQLTPETLLLLILFLLAALFFLLLGQRIGMARGRKAEESEWKTVKMEKIIRDRLKTSRAVLGGQISEQIAPFLPGFPFDPGDCRFIGKPVDFIVFKGMNEKEITEVIFLEVKSGTARALSPQERKLRDAVQAGRVRWEQYDISYEGSGS